MGLLRKPYEISYWEDVWQEAFGSTPAKYVEKRMFTIGSDTMDYQARAIEPVLTRKTNGEVNFSFKMYYQYIDNVTGEKVDNPFTPYLKNESKIKLNYNGEWFDLLIKNINKDSATKSYTYQLVDQHMVELSKNGFNVTLDSSLMNNLGTANELATKVLADTDWEVESEHIVATQDEALVMLLLPTNLANYKIYKIDDTNTASTLSATEVVDKEIDGEKYNDKSDMAGKPIYAFYSSCSGDKPYRFQFIYFTEAPEIQSDRIITTRNCQYYIDGIDKNNGWEIKDNFTIPKDFAIDTRENTTEIGNRSSISTLYRGRRYVYTQTSEYHAGLDMYLEKYIGSATNIKDAYFKYNVTDTVWEFWGKLGGKGAWSYYAGGQEPEDENMFPVGTIIKVENTQSDKPIYLLVTNSLIKSETESESRYLYEAIVIDPNSLPYYKYTKTNYVTPNLIQNVVNNAEFKGTSGWNGSKFTEEANWENLKILPITVSPQNYVKESWDRYTEPGRCAAWDGADKVNAGEFFFLTHCTIGDDDNRPICPILQASGTQDANKNYQAYSFGYVAGKPLRGIVSYYNDYKKFKRDYDKTTWEGYTKLRTIKAWTIGAPQGEKCEDRLRPGEYIYLEDCTVSDTGDKIYPYFQVIKYNGDNIWEFYSLGYVKDINDLPPYAPSSTSIKFSSPEYQPSLESVSMKKTTEVGSGKVVFTSAIEDCILYGKTPIGEEGYASYLLCKNLQSVGAYDADEDNKHSTVVKKAIVNSGLSDSIAFSQGVTEGEQYRLQLDFYVIAKTNDKDPATKNKVRYAVENSVTEQDIHFKIANLEYDTKKHGYDYAKAPSSSSSDGVLFKTMERISREGDEDAYLFSYCADLSALASLSAEAIKQSKYQMFLEFGGFPQSWIIQSASGSTDNGQYRDYFVLIKNFQFYKLYPKDEDEYYTPEDSINANNIAYNIEEKYFPVIENDKRTLENIEFCSTDTMFKPILSSDGAKKSCVNVKESNYFNIIQSIAQTFECWPKIEVNHDSNGYIIPFEEYEDNNSKKNTGKRIYFYNYVGQPNFAGFKYGVNSKDIKRTIDSNQIVSKLIVKANSNEYAPNGFCSIARAPQNDSKDNVIYNFGYYANKKLIDAVALQRDLYSPEDDWDISKLTNKTDGGLYITTAITETNINQYLSECTGYYYKMRPINTRLEELSKLISQNSAPLNEETAKYDTYKAMYDAAKSDLEEQQNRFYNLANFSYNNIPEDKIDVVYESSTLYPILETIVELAAAEQEAYKKYTAAEAEKAKYEEALDILEIQYDNALFLKATLNRLFYQRYSRFIQEGTWIDESYIDESLYYNDALSVSYNSSMPKVTYSMNVLALAGIPGFEFFDFKIGDQTFVEDIEFFGYNTAGNPHREEVTITETAENLDDPTKNAIKIRNYENQFEDLFQSITATVQSVQYTEGSYKKASALAEADAAHKFSFLNEAFEAVDARINDANNTVVIDTSGGKGITISNKNNKQEGLRLTSGAILLQGTDPDTGDKIWKTGLTAQGISASLITAGTVNTGEIQIMNGNEPTFRWDTHGITAYDFDNSESDVFLQKINTSQGVRFDRFGIYGYTGINGEKWKPTGIYTGTNSIEDHSTFYLTWEGLKVRNKNGATLRIGDNSKVGSDDKSIFKIINSEGDTAMNVTEEGEIQLLKGISWSDQASPVKEIYASPLANGDKPAKPNDGTPYSTIDLTANGQLGKWHRKQDPAIDIYASRTFDGGATWGEPVQTIAKDGAKGKTIETKSAYLLHASSSLSSSVTKPSGSSLNGWSTTIPEYDVSKNKRYIFVTQCIVTDGVYGSWTSPVLYSYLAADGKPGDPATVNKENVFNALTDNGTKNILEWNGEDLYINATYINGGILKAADSNGKITFSANVADGVVELGGWVANNSSLKTINYGLGENNSFHMYSIPTTASNLFGSSGSKDWMLGIGGKFGVTSDGSLYASAAEITGTIQNSNDYYTCTLTGGNMTIQSKDDTSEKTILSGGGLIAYGKTSGGHTMNYSVIEISQGPDRISTIQSHNYMTKNGTGNSPWGDSDWRLGQDTRVPDGVKAANVNTPSEDIIINGKGYHFQNGILVATYTVSH